MLMEQFSSPAILVASLISHWKEIFKEIKKIFLKKKIGSSTTFVNIRNFIAWKNKSERRSLSDFFITLAKVSLISHTLDHKVNFQLGISWDRSLTYFYGHPEGSRHKQLHSTEEGRPKAAQPTEEEKQDFCT